MLPLLFLLSGCFDIVEQIDLKSDGSGTFKAVLNLSKSKTKIGSLEKMKMVNGRKVPSRAEIKSKLEEVKAIIAKTSGISKVETSIDFTNYIATVTCNFTQVEKLNEAIHNVYKHDQPKAAKPDDTYAYNRASQLFSRLHLFPIKKEYEKLSSADREVFTGAFYTAIFKFDKTVASSSNQDAQTSPSKKAVMLKLNALDIINGKKSMANKIKLNLK